MNESHFLSIEKKFPDDPLIGLLSDISWSIMNFDKRFTGDRNSRTIIVSPALASVYDTKVVDGDFCIGFQEDMFKRMWDIPWKLALVIRNSPGIYFCFATGAKPPNHYGLIRFYLRSKETDSLLMYDKVKVIRVSPEGDNMSWRPNSHFYLPLKKINAPDWA